MMMMMMMVVVVVVMILCQFSGRRPFEDKPRPTFVTSWFNPYEFRSTLALPKPLWGRALESWKNQNRFSSTITTSKWPPLRAFLQTVFAKWSIHTQDHVSSHLLKTFHLATVVTYHWPGSWQPRTARGSLRSREGNARWIFWFQIPFCFEKGWQYFVVYPNLHPINST